MDYSWPASSSKAEHHVSYMAALLSARSCPYSRTRLALQGSQIQPLPRFRCAPSASMVECFTSYNASYLASTTENFAVESDSLGVSSTARHARKAMAAAFADPSAVSLLWLSNTLAHVLTWVLRYDLTVVATSHIRRPLVLHSDLSALLAQGQRTLQRTADHLASDSELVSVCRQWLEALDKQRQACLDAVKSNIKQRAQMRWSLISHSHWRCSRSTLVSDEMTEVVQTIIAPAASAIQWLNAAIRVSLLESIITEAVDALGNDIIERKCKINRAGAERLHSDIEHVKQWIETSADICDEDRQTLLAAEIFVKFRLIYRVLSGPLAASIPRDAEKYLGEISQWQRLRVDGVAKCYVPFFCAHAAPPSPTIMSPDVGTGKSQSRLGH